MKVHIKTDSDNRGEKRKTQQFHADQEQIKEIIKEHMPEMIESIEDFFKDWDGESIILLSNSRKLGKIQMLITGIDQPVDMLDLAFHAHEAQKELVKVTREGVSKQSFAAAVLELADRHDHELDDEQLDDIKKILNND